ncbi:MAG: hypothetical protein WCI49_08120 [Ferruginibacter sp.]
MSHPVRDFLHALVNSLYNRGEGDFTRGNFRVKGDTVDINLHYMDFGYRITFFGDELKAIETLELSSGNKIGVVQNAAIFPANLYVAPKDVLQQVINEIQDDAGLQTDYFKNSDKYIEANRLNGRVNYDFEMIRDLGYCSGIENYSRFFLHRRRQPSNHSAGES